MSQYHTEARQQGLGGTWEPALRSPPRGPEQVPSWGTRLASGANRASKPCPALLPCRGHTVPPAAPPRAPGSSCGIRPGWEMPGLRRRQLLESQKLEGVGDRGRPPPRHVDYFRNGHHTGDILTLPSTSRSGKWISRVKGAHSPCAWG